MCVPVYVKKPLSGSCVVWMLRPLSTACQDAPSQVRYPKFMRECKPVKMLQYHELKCELCVHVHVSV